MLVFKFDGGLFKFNANTPAFTPLFQLPPRIADTAPTLSFTRLLALDPATEKTTDLVNTLCY